MAKRKKRHSALYQQLVQEYCDMGYDRKEAMQIASEYLTINEMYEDYDDTGNDDDFQRTFCHIKDREDEEE